MSSDLTDKAEVVEEVAIVAFGAMRGHEPRPQSWHHVPASTQAAWRRVAQAVLAHLARQDPSSARSLQP